MTFCGNDLFHATCSNKKWQSGTPNSALSYRDMMDSSTTVTEEARASASTALGCPSDSVSLVLRCSLELNFNFASSCTYTVHMLS